MSFAGYAAVFDHPDRGGDVIRAGAFGDLRPVPLLWSHTGAPVGRIARIAEDVRGLRVLGIIDAGGLADAVREGRITGLSFGYRVEAVRQGVHREIRRLRLGEVSLVARPMQPLARIHAVAG